MVNIKRVYDPPAPDDGERYLVDRLWPRGLSKEMVHLTAWLKDLAPSHELRRWFDHNPERWEEFQERYAGELAAPDRQALLGDLAARAKENPVTLVYASREQERNNARFLQILLKKRLEQV